MNLVDCFSKLNIEKMQILFRIDYFSSTFQLTVNHISTRININENYIIQI